MSHDLGTTAFFRGADALCCVDSVDDKEHDYFTHLDVNLAADALTADLSVTDWLNAPPPQLCSAADEAADAEAAEAADAEAADAEAADAEATVDSRRDLAGTPDTEQPNYLLIDDFLGQEQSVIGMINSRLASIIRQPPPRIFSNLGDAIDAHVQKVKAAAEAARAQEAKLAAFTASLPAPDQPTCLICLEPAGKELGPLVTPGCGCKHLSHTRCMAEFAVSQAKNKEIELPFNQIYACCHVCKRKLTGDARLCLGNTCYESHKKCHLKNVIKRKAIMVRCNAHIKAGKPANAIPYLKQLLGHYKKPYHQNGEYEHVRALRRLALAQCHMEKFNDAFSNMQVVCNILSHRDNISERKKLAEARAVCALVSIRCNKKALHGRKLKLPLLEEARKTLSEDDISRLKSRFAV